MGYKYCYEGIFTAPGSSMAGWCCKCVKQHNASWNFDKKGCDACKNRQREQQVREQRAREEELQQREQACSLVPRLSGDVSYNHVKRAL